MNKVAAFEAVKRISPKVSLTSNMQGALINFEANIAIPSYFPTLTSRDTSDNSSEILRIPSTTLRQHKLLSRFSGKHNHEYKITVK